MTIRRVSRRWAALAHVPEVGVLTHIPADWESVRHACEYQILT